MSAVPERPIDAGWLALREPADTRARDGVAAQLLPPLIERLAGPGTTGDGLRIVDLGAGTGANLRWLAPRLPAPSRQRWVLVDHDHHLLTRQDPAGMRYDAVPVEADVTDLARLQPVLGGVDLVTAAALLDLLDLAQLTAVVGAVVSFGVPALFSLTVTGGVTLDPPDPLDAAVADAFDAHQQRGRRLGPVAGDVAADLFRECGYAVTLADTPWALRADDEPDLLTAWIDGRADAVLEQEPDTAPAVCAWRDRRHTQVAQSLVATIGHVDLLALPG